MTIQVGMNEAALIAIRSIEITNRESPGNMQRDFEDFPPMLQAQAVAGIIRVIEALQELGYIVTRSDTLATRNEQ